MRATQGNFSFLPDLTDEQIRRKLAYALGRGWALSIEHTDDPSPCNVLWEAWGDAMFDVPHAAEAMDEVKACRAAHPGRYVKVVAFEAAAWQTVRLSFLVQRPRVEATCALVREHVNGRRVRHATRSPGRAGRRGT